MSDGVYVVDGEEGGGVGDIVVDLVRGKELCACVPVCATCYVSCGKEQGVCVMAVSTAKSFQQVVATWLAIKN